MEANAKMDKKDSFNQLDYIKEYNKKHYVNLTVRVKPEVNKTITDYCKDMNISKAAFITSACKFIINNDIPLSEFMEKSDK